MLKKNLFFLLFIFTIPSIAGDYYNPAHIPSLNVTFDTSSSENTHSLHSRIRTPEWNDHHKKNNNYYAHLTVVDFHKIFTDTLNEHDVLSNYELYAYPTFREYAKSLSGYNKFIVSLGTKIKTDKHFRKKTAYIPGFAYSFGLRGEKSGFHDFVFEEAQRIEQGRNNQKIVKKQGSLCISEQALNYLGQEWSAKSKIFSDNARMADRLNALHVTRNHKNKSINVSFATELDYQLYKELTESRGTMHHLERNFAYSYHIKLLSPVVYNCATQAAREECPIAAFQLSDFCHTVTQVLQRGMHVLYDATHAVAKGVAKSAISIVSIDHWKDMATGCLQLGLLFADAVGQGDALHYAVVSSAFSQDSDVLLKSAQLYCVYTQAQKDAVNRCVQETCQKLKSMTWQELLEGGTEVGVTIVLDTLVLNAIGRFTHAASESFIKHLTKATESGAIFTEKYAIEVAGFGKLIVEEGADVAVKAADLIKKELVLCTDNQSVISQVRRQISQAKYVEDIVQKIRNVGDGILDIMEKAGGHTLERHVGKSYDYLKSRSLGIKNGSATTFINKRIAIDSVKENMKYNAEKIALWLNNEVEEIACEFTHSYSIGKGVFKHKNNPYYDLYKSKMILKKDTQCEWGFKMLTAFPV